MSLHWIAAGTLLALVLACERTQEPGAVPTEPQAEAPAAGRSPAVQPPTATSPRAAPAPLGSVQERLRTIEQIPFSGSDGKQAVSELEDHLQDPELDVREAAVMALAEVEGDAANQALARHLKVEKDSMLKIDIVDELIDREAPQALDSLLFVLADTDTEVRERAADGLDELGDARAVPALHDAFRAESDEFVRDAILFALSSLDPDFDEEEYELEQD
jgi:HEAT repeat protein